jgi:Zn-dependent protease with chaperone function
VRGPAIYYDGLSARQRPAEVVLEADGLLLVENGIEIARWRYSDLRRQDAPAGLIRIGSMSAPELARLEITDRALAAEIDRRGVPRADSGASGRTVLVIVTWSLAAAVSLVLTAVYVVPLVSDRLAPMVPVSVERRIGEAVDNQVRTMLGKGTCSTPAGDAALAALVAKMTAKVSSPLPIEVAVLRSSVPNAMALPGGRIYLLGPLLERAQNVDEVAGVLAHEIGHVVHRDTMRVLIQQGGTSFLLGLLFGDVTGAGVVIFVGRTLVDSAYSRDAERGADKFAAELMLQLGRSPRPLGVFLARIMREFGSESRALAFMQSHPLSEERLAALSQSEPSAPGAPLLSESEWQALRAICKS